LRQAIKQVPAVGFALGVAGIASAGALVTSMVGYGHASVVIIGGTFIAMVLLYLFSAIVASKSEATTILGIILLYSVILFFVASYYLQLRRSRSTGLCRGSCSLELLPRHRLQNLGLSLSILDHSKSEATKAMIYSSKISSTQAQLILS
jgi:hypothetical protein